MRRDRKEPFVTLKGTGLVWSLLGPDWHQPSSSYGLFGHYTLEDFSLSSISVWLTIYLPSYVSQQCLRFAFYLFQVKIKQFLLPRGNQINSIMPCSPSSRFSRVFFSTWKLKRWLFTGAAHLLEFPFRVLHSWYSDVTLFARMIILVSGISLIYGQNWLVCICEPEPLSNILMILPVHGFPEFEWQERYLDSYDELTNRFPCAYCAVNAHIPP
jgi:hypothetical protein